MEMGEVNNSILVNSLSELQFIPTNTRFKVYRLNLGHNQFTFNIVGQS